MKIVFVRVLLFRCFIEWSSCSYRFTTFSRSIDLLAGHVVGAVDLPWCLTIVRTGFLSITSLTVIQGLVVSLLGVMMFFLELVKMRLQALLILQIVLEEDILLGLRLYESIFDW